MTTAAPLRMTPMDVARRMMRNHADPGLIAAYLKHELDLDPTWAMTPIQRLQAAIRGVWQEYRKMGLALAQHPAFKLAVKLAAEQEERQRKLAVLTAVPGLCDGCDRTDRIVRATADGRALLCGACLAISEGGN